jgi:hypothetical protein
LFPQRFLLLLFLAGPATRVVGQQAPPLQDSTYHQLLARLKTRDTTIDFTALRLAFAASEDYAPYGSDADVHCDSLSAALEHGDFRRALNEADSALAIDYLDVRTHVLRAYAAEQLGDDAAASWHRAVATLLVRSVAQSGTGAVDSPYVVISVAEEYALLDMTGYRRTLQAVGQCGSKPCDVLEAEHQETGAKRTFHFDISLPSAFLDRIFKPK